MINNKLLNAYLDAFAEECSKGNEMDNRAAIKSARENILRVVTDLVAQDGKERVRLKKAHDSASHRTGCTDEGCLGQCMVR